MKLKFKVSSRDLLMFGAFAIVLFYLCAIAVLNFSSFSSTGAFSGLNPFPAFSAKYFPPTIIFFIIALILIFSGLSSYIFEKDSRSPGLGLSVGEVTEGYSRWSTERELEKSYDVKKINPHADTIDAAGVPLKNNGRNIWVDDGENHSLVIGATGSGKTETLVKPMVKLMAKRGESMIITDPKGEIYEYSASELKERGYNIIVLNFRDPQNGNAWNPLGLPYKLYSEGNIDKATELLDDVARNILYDPNNKGEPFWENSSADFFSGLSLGLFEDAKEEEVNINSISYMSIVGEEKFARDTYMKEYFSLKGETSSAYTFASNTINAPAETKGGILSVFRQKIRQFAAQQNLSEMLSHSDFDMRDIGREKTAVFLLVHDEKKTYHGLCTIFIKQCYESLIGVAQDNGGKLKNRTNFILDEFANMPPLKDVTTMITAARSRRIRFTLIIQNFAQLKDVYGDQDAETLKGNCGNMIYLITTELAALEEISKLCGDIKSRDKDKTASTPLVTVADLQKLKKFEVIIKRYRMNPYKTRLTTAFEMQWGKKYEKGELPVREKEEVQVFDIKGFVKEKKKAQMFDNPEMANNPLLPGGFGGMPNGLPSGMLFPDMPPRERSTGVNPNIDIDEFVKNIDKKIAELEEEEKKEEAKKKQKEEKPEVIEIPTNNKKAVNIYNEKPKTEKIELLDIPKQDDVEIIEKPKINVDADSIIVDNNNVSDDQFFDDFFGDE